MKASKGDFTLDDWDIGAVDSIGGLEQAITPIVHENMQYLIDNLELELSYYAPNGNDLVDGDITVTLWESEALSAVMGCSLKELIDEWVHKAIEEQDGSSRIVRQMRAVAEHLVAAAKRLEVEAPDRD